MSGFGRTTTGNVNDLTTINQTIRTFKLMKNSKCSFTVSLSKSTLCCGQSPRLSRIASISVSILLPSTWAEPEVGGKRPVKMDIVVVFPAPLWPSNAVIWPLYMFRVSPSTATFEPVEPWREKMFKELYYTQAPQV